MKAFFSSPIGKLLSLFLLLGFFVGLWFVSTKRPEILYLPDDPQAQEALRLVKNHSARTIGTVDEALTRMVERLKSNGVTLHEGKWRVASQGPDTYLVSKIIREKGSVEWIERDFAWRVNVKEKWVKVISLAAQGLMPFENLPPLPHGSEISSLLMLFG